MKESHDIASVVQILQAQGLEVSTDQRIRLARYADLLRSWNARINLISRKDEEQLWRNHILHSLAILLLLPLPRSGRVIDIGSGGGLPGIPLAIMLPETAFVLADSVGKKIRAVGEMADELGLGNVTTFNGRVEDDIFLRLHGRSADCVTARAVTHLEALARWSAPLLSPAGARRLVAWKGGDLREEIAAAGRHPLVRGTREILMNIPGEPWFAGEEKKLVEVLFT